MYAMNISSISMLKSGDGSMIHKNSKISPLRRNVSSKKDEEPMLPSWARQSAKDALEVLQKAELDIAQGKRKSVFGSNNLLDPMGSVEEGDDAVLAGKELDEKKEEAMMAKTDDEDKAETESN